MRRRVLAPILACIVVAVLATVVAAPWRSPAPPAPTAPVLGATTDPECTHCV